MTLPKILHGNITQLTTTGAPRKPPTAGTTVRDEQDGATYVADGKGAWKPESVAKLKAEIASLRKERDHFRDRYHAVLAKVTEATAILAAAKISAADAQRGPA